MSAWSFRTKLLASHIGLVLIVGLIAIFTLNRWLTDDLVRQLDVRMEEQARGAIEWAEEGGRRHPEKVAMRIAHIVDAEVTLFDSSGTVIGASTQEARKDTGEEVQGARTTGIGKATRARAGQDFHYVAVKGADQIVVRLAVPLSDVSETVAAMRRRLVVASGVAIVVAIILGVLAARVASRPLGQMTAAASRLAEGDFDVPMEAGGSDDFGVLWRALKSLAQQLKARIGELVAERDRLSSILAGMIEGVLVIDRSGTIIVANPAIERILGSKSFVGKRLDDVRMPAEARALIERCIPEGAGGGDAPDPKPSEAELEVHDERGMALAVYVRPLAESRSGAVVAVLRDETALRKLMTIRRDFVANVSHELRTPVTAIQGYAETLLRGKTDPETSKQFLEIVHRQAQRIGGLVEQLLALSELEARSRDEIAREPVRVVSVAQHVAESVHGRAEARNVKVSIDAKDDLEVLADSEGLERAVINLVDNAIKYGKESGSVAIAARRENGSVKIAVTDDGPGIEEGHLGRVFERFYRIDPGRSRAHGGAGLGLSIVKHLVESMDGTITVTSRVGSGTTFEITLPSP
ncbi:MAG: HAMP domain-containing protein [Deltaproteobacteria bacterium]|nr:HAMP domain-containing protein [Deltaproteobacteria bacterium]